MLVRRFRNRGATTYIEAHGEVMFAEGAVLGRWKNRLSNRITAATRAAAPSNKRPRWSHYGPPLKTTISSSTSTRITRGGGFFYIGVGSSAPYALYVDQGTGVFGGNGPYQAKILPPWQPGSASLYEHTWSPKGPGGRPVGTITVKGQPGQEFFSEGLKNGLRSMRLRSYQVPGEGVSGISKTLREFPAEMLSGPGNTPATGSFIASLNEWRAWRDEAWMRGEGLGRGGGVGSKAQDRFRKQAQGRPKTTTSTPKSSAPKKPKKTAPPKKTTTQKPDPTKKPKRGWETVKQKKEAAVAEFMDRNPNVKVLKWTPEGLAVRTNRGPYIIPWSRLYAMLPRP